MVLITRYFPKRAHGSVLTALPDIVRFLVNEHSSLTGPGWSIVEACANSIREVPANSASLDSLTSAIAWPNGTLAAGDWIVLESADGNNTNHFQLYMEADSSSILGLLLIPLANFVTDDGGIWIGGLPTFPTTSVGITQSLPLGLSGTANTAYYSVVADQGMLTYLFDDGIDANVRWTYVGELNGAKENGSPADDRAYVIYDDASNVGFSVSTTTAFRAWNRLSPLDDSTHLNASTTAGAPAFFCPAAAVRPLHTNNERDFLLGVDSITPVGVHFFGGIHRHFAGFLRNVFSVHSGLGSAGMLNDRSFIYRNTNVTATTFAGVCIRWDGSTLFP